MSPLWVRDERTGALVRAFPIDLTQAKNIAMLIAVRTPAPEMVRKLRGFGLKVPLNSKSFAVDVALDPYQAQLRISEKPLSIHYMGADERKQHRDLHGAGR